MAYAMEKIKTRIPIAFTIHDKESGKVLANPIMLIARDDSVKAFLEVDVNVLR